MPEEKKIELKEKKTESNYNPLAEDNDINNIKKDGSVAFVGTGDGFKDEDDMISDSPNAVASQQSIKKYVNDETFDLLDEDNMASDSAIAAASQQSIKKYVDDNSAGDQLIKSYTAGETIADGNALFVADGTETIGTDESNTGSALRDFGNSTTNNVNKVAQSFQFDEATTIEKIKIKLRNENSPTDSVKISIQSDNAGVPSGTDLASVTKGNADLDGTLTEYTETLSAEVSCAASTKYWIVFERTGSGHDTNKYSTASGGTYANGQGYKIDIGGSWADYSMDFFFEFLIPVTADRVYRTRADETTMINFVGIADAAGTIGSTLNVVVGGIKTKSGWGLTAKTIYYLSDTKGAIATSAGTNGREIGKTLTATTIWIYWRVVPTVTGDMVIFEASDVLKASADTQQTVTAESYTKYKEIELRRSGVVRIKFDLMTANYNVVGILGRIYLNGVAIGTARTKSDNNNWETYSEDIEVTVGDKVQLYCYRSTTDALTYTRNFRIYYDTADGNDYEVELN